VCASVRAVLRLLLFFFFSQAAPDAAIVVQVNEPVASSTVVGKFTEGLYYNPVVHAVSHHMRWPSYS